MSNVIINTDIPYEENSREIITNVLLDAINLISKLTDRDVWIKTTLMKYMLVGLSKCSDKEILEVVEEHPELTMIYAALAKEPNRRYSYDNEEPEKEGIVTDE